VSSASELDLSEAARRHLKQPFLLTDWHHTVFLHFAVDVDVLQPHVPFTLDCWESRAYVSMVAFQQRRFVLRRGGRATSWLTGPIGSHDFCNVRTYVRPEDEPGVFFLTEWISRRLTVLIARALYGLPYRFAQLRYDHDARSDMFRAEVAAPGGGRLACRAHIDYNHPVAPAPANSLEAFTMERYTAYTQRGKRRRRFRIWHEPWPQQRIEAELREDSLLRQTFKWYQAAQLIAANYSPGVRGVWIGYPHRVRGESQAAEFGSIGGHPSATDAECMV
jgi:uncharacterized protein